MWKIAVVVIFVQTLLVMKTNGMMNEASVRRGRDQLMELEGRAAKPVYGRCWTKAIKQLHWQCLELDENIQGRLALRFTNCLLEQAGHKTHPCPDDHGLDDCLKDVDDKTFNAYTTFYTHTAHICNFLKGHLWQRESEKAMGRLMDVSEHVVMNTEETVQNQQKMLKNQRSTLQNQRHSQEHGEKLEDLLKTTLTIGGKLLETVKMAEDVHQRTWGLVLNWFLVIHSTIINELAGLYSVVYYAAYIIIAYIFTTTEQINQARFGLYVLMLIGYTSEYGMNQLIILWYQSGDISMVNKYAEELTVARYKWTWIIREIILTLACTLVLRCWLYYEDINRANNVILHQIWNQIKPEQDTALEISQTVKQTIEDESDDSYDSQISNSSWRRDGIMTEEESSSDEEEFRPLPFRGARERAIRAIKLIASRQDNYLYEREPGDPNRKLWGDLESEDEFGHLISAMAKKNKLQRKKFIKDWIQPSRLCKKHKIANCNVCN